MEVVGWRKKSYNCRQYVSPSGYPHGGIPFEIQELLDWYDNGKDIKYVNDLHKTRKIKDVWRNLKETLDDIYIYIIDCTNLCVLHKFRTSFMLKEEKEMRIILDIDKKTITVPWNYTEKLDAINKTDSGRNRWRF